jgi:hypothetical protein
VAPPFGQAFVVEKKKVIVPVGLLPPAKVALSETEPPTDMGVDESKVVRVGVTIGLTTSGSQALVTALLLASPLYVAYQ